MPSLVIPVQDGVFDRLRERASAHGRTPEAEAKALLEGILQAPVTPIWERVNAFRHALATSGRTFCDSAELLREDRDR